MSWETQDKNQDAVVKVSTDYSRNANAAGIQQTDILVFDKSTGEHVHLTAPADAGQPVVQQHDWRK